MRFNFCPACATPLVARPEHPGESPRATCPACGFITYDNPKPAASVLIERDGRVLLARRARPPFVGYWDIPGGFLDGVEHPEIAAAREVAEETGLRVRLGRLLGIYMDRYGEDGDPTLNFFYLADLPQGGAPRPADDVSELDWFAPDALPDRVAFACCRAALADWARLRRSPLPLGEG
jgi:ADP-ribose pyrophosphatase YjhB (NUDIX family)